MCVKKIAKKLRQWTYGIYVNSYKDQYDPLSVDYNGCPEQPRDGRDIVLGDIPYVPDPNCPTYEQGFSNEDKHGKLKREHQMDFLLIPQIDYLLL